MFFFRFWDFLFFFPSLFLAQFNSNRRMNWRMRKLCEQKNWSERRFLEQIKKTHHQISVGNFQWRFYVSECASIVRIVHITPGWCVHNYKLPFIKYRTLCEWMTNLKTYRSAAMATRCNIDAVQQRTSHDVHISQSSGPSIQPSLIYIAQHWNDFHWNCVIFARVKFE